MLHQVNFSGRTHLPAAEVLPDYEPNFTLTILLVGPLASRQILVKLGNVLENCHAGQ